MAWSFFVEMTCQQTHTQSNRWFFSTCVCLHRWFQHSPPPPPHTHTQTLEQVLGFIYSPFRHCLFLVCVCITLCAVFFTLPCVLFSFKWGARIFESMKLFPLTLPRNCRVIIGVPYSIKNRASSECFGQFQRTLINVLNYTCAALTCNFRSILQPCEEKMYGCVMLDLNKQWTKVKDCLYWRFIPLKWNFLKVACERWGDFWSNFQVKHCWLIYLNSQQLWMDSGLMNRHKQFLLALKLWTTGGWFWKEDRFLFFITAIVFD